MDANRSSVIWNKIQKVHNTRRYDAITLLVNDKTSYIAHRFILSVSSDVFEAMLSGSTWNEAHQTVVKLHEDPLCAEVFATFLEYFYTSRPYLTVTNLMPMLILADKYCVSDLTEECILYMLDNLSEAAEGNNIIHWFQYVVARNRPAKVYESYYYQLWRVDGECIDMKPQWSKLYKAIKNFIKWNLDSCVGCFNTFELDILVGLLKQTDIVVFDEMTLFNYVASWLYNKFAEDSLQLRNSNKIRRITSPLIQDVMRHIRFPMMLSWQISHLLITPIVTENKDYFIEKMAAAMKYHVVKTEPQSTTDYLVECTPRLYSGQNWGDTYRVFFKSANELNTHEKSTLITLFGKGHEHEKSKWIITFVHCPLMMSEQIFKIVKVKIEQKETERLHCKVRVTILVRTFKKRAPKEISYVSSVLQNVVNFEPDKCWVSESIVCGKINQEDDESFYKFMENRMPMKFSVIITPIVDGITDCSRNLDIQHVLDDFII